MNADLGVVTEEDEDAHLVDASGRVCEKVRRVQRRDPRGGSSCLEGGTDGGVVSILVVLRRLCIPGRVSGGAGHVGSWWWCCSRRKKRLGEEGVAGRVDKVGVKLKLNRAH